MRLSSLLLLVWLATLSGCTGEEPPQGPRPVVAYVAHDRLFSDPVLAKFTAAEVQVVGDTETSKTTGLVQRLIQLADRPEADVFWNNEILRTVQLAELGLLEPYIPRSASGIPESYCDPQGRWVGFAARARVILVNTDKITPEQTPESVLDLVDPRYRGQVVIANPLFGTTATHIAVLYHELGEERTRQFLESLVSNDVRVVAGNAMARNLVMNGEVAICLTDTDDANGAFLKDKPVRMVYPDQEGMGALLIPNTVGIVRGGPNPAGARQLVEFLASEAVEEQLCRSKSAQLPLRPGIAPHSSRFDPTTFRAMKVNWTEASHDFEAAMRLAQEVLLR